MEQAKTLQLSGCDKSAIARAFGKAAKSYDQAAELQRQVGDSVLIHLQGLHSVGAKALDVGCGTGHFSHKLHNKGYQVTGLDLSLGMLEQAKQRQGDIDWVHGDAERLPFADNQFDVAFSSLALQWCDDLSVPLKEMQRVVKPRGKILFSTLVDGSLQELANAWQAIDRYQHVNQFIPKKAVKLALAQLSSQHNSLEFLPFVMRYPRAIDLMRDLKGIGATHVTQGRQQGLATRGVFSRLEQEYDRYRGEDGLLPATYHVCVGVITND